MEIKAYLHILARKWWVIVICCAITLSATLAFTLSQAEVYETTTTYVVRPRPGPDDKEGFVKTLDMVSRNSEISNTFSEVANSKLIRQAALMKLALTPEKQKGLSVNARVIGGTNILELNVQGPDPIVVRDFANVVGTEFVSYIGDLYDVFDLELLDEAGLPKNPMKSNLMLNLMIGGFLGVVLGSSLIFTIQYFQTPSATSASFNIIDRETGAYNRSYFMLRLWQELSRAKRNKYPLSLGLIKIEIYGAEDNSSLSDFDRTEAMRVVKALTEQTLREEDILARFDHDVYAVLLPDIRGEKAKASIENLLIRINSLTVGADESGEGFKITGIAGVISNVNMRSPQEQFLKHAMSALENSERGPGGKVIMIPEQSIIESVN